MEDKGLIFACFAGTGKSFLGEKYKNVIDLESALYKWNTDGSDIETIKGCKNLELNENWPNNYINDIYNYYKKGYIVLITTSNEILSILLDKETHFYLCYPKIECKNEYTRNFLKRGNSLDFITCIWKKYNELINDDSLRLIPKLILEENEYLEDYIKEKTLIKLTPKAKQRLRSLKLTISTWTTNL